MLDVLSVIIVLAVLYAIVSVPVGIFNLKVFQAVHGTKCTGLSILKAFAPSTTSPSHESWRMGNPQCST